MAYFKNNEPYSEEPYEEEEDAEEYDDGFDELTQEDEPELTEEELQDLLENGDVQG